MNPIYEQPPITKLAVSPEEIHVLFEKPYFQDFDVDIDFSPIIPASYKYGAAIESFKSAVSKINFISPIIRRIKRKVTDFQNARLQKKLEKGLACMSVKSLPFFSASQVDAMNRRQDRLAERLKYRQECLKRKQEKADRETAAKAITQ